MKKILWGGVLLSALVGCQSAPKKEPPKPVATPSVVEKQEPPKAPASASSQATSQASAPQKEELPWIKDNGEEALAKAKAQGKPLFVDLWAPWCHTCIAMQGHILIPENMAELKEQFVFLAIDTEKELNAAFLQKYPVEVWPTFYVIEPEQGQIVGRWLGAGSVQQIRSFLKDGEKAVAQIKAGPLPPDDPMALLLAGDRAAHAKNYKEAAQKYTEALQKAPADWPRRADVLVSQIAALADAKDFSGCADVGLSSMKDTGNTSSVTDFASVVLSCADELPKEDPRAEKIRKAAAERIGEVADDPSAPLSIDDRGDAYGYWKEALSALSNGEDSKEILAVVSKRVAFLEESTKGEPDDIAVAYDWALADSYLYLKEEQKAIDLLNKREAALPKNYNPPHYLARVYHKLKREPEALAAIDRALLLAYGPRKAGMMGVKADILEAMEKKADARAVVEEQLKMYQSLPEGQKMPEREAKVKARLEKMPPQ